MDFDNYGLFKLVYMHKISKDFKNEFTYEMIFSKNAEECDGDGWEFNPIADNCYPPKDQYIDKLIRFKTEFDLFVVTENSDYSQNIYAFCYYDVCDGVIAMAWDTNDSNEERLVFRYNETLEHICEKLKDKQIVIELI